MDQMKNPCASTEPTRVLASHRTGRYNIIFWSFFSTTQNDDHNEWGSSLLQALGGATRWSEAARELIGLLGLSRSTVLTGQVLWMNPRCFAARSSRPLVAGRRQSLLSNLRTRENTATKGTTRRTWTEAGTSHYREPFSSGESEIDG